MRAGMSVTDNPPSIPASCHHGRNASYRVRRLHSGERLCGRNPPRPCDQGVILRVENPPYRGFPTDSRMEYCDYRGTASIIVPGDKWKRLRVGGANIRGGLILGIDLGIG